MLVADDTVKLTDFGLARPASDTAGGGRVRGTAPYLPPEVARGGPRRAGPRLTGR